MKISKIVQQAKQQNRYSVFIDGKYGFSLSEAALLESGLASGQEVTDQELGSWKRRSGEDKLYALALKYVAARSRSTWEVESYLQRKASSPALTQKILNKLTKLTLLNDEAFAHAWVAYRRLLRPTSKRKLQQELRAKHVSDEMVGRAVSSSDMNERSTLHELITRKRHLTRYQDEHKLMAYLVRQGFAYDDIKQALKFSEEDL